LKLENNSSDIEHSIKFKKYFKKKQTFYKKKECIISILYLHLTLSSWTWKYPNISTVYFIIIFS